jgi:putative transposase
MRSGTHWQWHLDEVFVKVNGETHYLRRTVDHEGEVLESFVAKRRDRKATLKFLRKIMKRHGRPHIFVTDKLRSYGAAMKEIGNVVRQESGRSLNNRAENSHQPFRRREQAMLRFRQMRTLQKLSPSTPRSTTISIKSATSIDAIPLSSTAPPFWTRGVNFFSIGSDVWRRTQTGSN